MVQQKIFLAITIFMFFLTIESTAGIRQCDCRYRKCSYVGDPHLIPYPSFYGGPQNQYFCQHEGWETLVSNNYVSVYVFVGGAPYWILDYVVIFHDSPPCVLVGSGSGSLVCANTTDIHSVQSASGTSWTHFYKRKCIIVQIEKWGSYYNIHVYQSFQLIQQSVGLCRRWRCKQETAWIKPLPVISEVCKIFINAARQRAMGEVEENMAEIAETSCVNDMQTTFDPQVGWTAVSLVLHGSVESQLGSEETEAVFEKANSLKLVTIQEATKQANELLANTKELCNDQKQCLRPIIERDK